MENLAATPPHQQPSSNQSVKAGAAIVGAIALLSAGALWYKRSATEAVVPGQTETPAAAEVTGSPSIVEGKFKQGTFTAVGNYVSPGGPETVKVTLTLKEDVISDVTFEPQATLPMSQKFQGQFAEGYKELVVGKNINDVKLDKVSGSSLTPQGFNDAIEKIKTQAAS